jgi:hypothetical protein
LDFQGQLPQKSVPSAWTSYVCAPVLLLSFEAAAPGNPILTISFHAPALQKIRTVDLDGKVIKLQIVSDSVAEGAAACKRR